MTEAEWLACTEAYPMVQSVHGILSDRKQRLFAAACYRKALHWLGDEKNWQGIDVLERHADGMAGEAERTEAGRFARKVYHATEGSAEDPLAQRRSIAFLVLYRLIVAGSGSWAARDAYSTTAQQFDPTRPIVFEDDSEGYFRLVIDVFGNPFRRIPLAPSWLAWNDGTVRKMAQAIYDDRAFDRLPILADAFEDAGCDNPDILAHCRSGEEHVRGCWVVDLVLGKS